LYRFDKVSAQTANQRQVFDEAGLAKMVRRVVEGYHSTIFAYGQTGSGKTYTMEGYKYEANEKGLIVPKIV
jgi:kinesin family protein 4/21/27